LREFLDRGSSDFWWREVPMSVDMHGAASALVSSMVHNELTPLQLEASSLQLLYLGIRSLERASPDTALSLNARDLRVIERTAQILQREFADAPRIGALARRVGMNDAKLCAGFKQVFGMTISAYTRHLCMRRAKTLLEESTLSIVEVAVEVGYGHPGNFATAFKRYFGVTPTQARRGSLRRGRLVPVRSCRSKVSLVSAGET
ncbi:MAG: AraC family transcriptional regulator, partial [Gammaproteobacteria bacterium]|nr:AraC family transcriptional regulator [Gammaproteobacteria bacterium]